MYNNIPESEHSHRKGFSEVTSLMFVFKTDKKPFLDFAVPHDSHYDLNTRKEKKKNMGFAVEIYSF